MKPEAYPARRQTKCPLCESEGAKVESQFSASELVGLYRDSLEIEVGDHFTNSDMVRLMSCQNCALSYFDPLAAGSDRFYQELVSKSWYYNSEKPEFSFASSKILTSDRILDVGCGSGKFANYVDRETYVGLELSSHAVKAARSSGLTVHQRSIGEYAAEFPESADVVCAFQVLEHVSDPRGFLKDCISSLRPGGTLIVSVPNSDSFLRFAVNNILNCPPHHVTWWNREALMRVAEIFSLTVADIHSDRLADEHLESYANTLILSALSGNRSCLIDSSFRTKLFSKIASVVRPRLMQMLHNDGLRPAGHSITFVYLKS